MTSLDLSSLSLSLGWTREMCSPQRDWKALQSWTWRFARLEINHNFYYSHSFILLFIHCSFIPVWFHFSVTSFLLHSCHFLPSQFICMVIHFTSHKPCSFICLLFTLHTHSYACFFMHSYILLLMYSSAHSCVKYMPLLIRSCVHSNFYPSITDWFMQSFFVLRSAFSFLFVQHLGVTACNESLFLFMYSIISLFNWCLSSFTRTFIHSGPKIFNIPSFMLIHSFLVHSYHC